MERKQFTFYRSFYENLQKISKKSDRLALYEAITRYALDGIEPESLNNNTDVAFGLIRPVLDTARTRSEAGLRGNERRWSQTDRKPIANRSQTDRKGENEKEKEIESEIEIEGDSRYIAPRRDRDGTA